MIKLIGLDGSIFYVNYFQILCIELIPETKVLLTNGRYYLVKDSIESVQKKIETFLHGCITLEDRDLLAEAGISNLQYEGGVR
ncbi:MAG: flagellar FlbD family protein [Lachnospiraceae bacterium]|nr:flagellar FlbD family protein [Lachnospiraceae bacterium]